ncbi:methionine--tRNA ligase, cytoplasmic-like isoform X2 [Dysidea avara]|uniref:methionine--tRNA ligase, cytoplasmic-like isoform X2 n=1 Tax=Dysidea avara TaxID=196820 RepID=UPI00332C297C
MSYKLYYNYGDLDYLKVCLLVEWLKVPTSSFTLVHGKPQGPVPSLKDNSSLILDAEGLILYSANEICRCLYECQAGVKQESESFDWLQWEFSRLKPAVHDSLKKGAITDSLKALLILLDSQFKHKYITGVNCSLADVVLFSTLYPVFIDQSPLSKGGSSSDYKHLIGWFTKLLDNSDNAVQQATNKRGIQGFLEYYKTFDTATPGSSNVKSILVVPHGVPELSGEDERSKVTTEEMEMCKQSWTTSLDDIPQPIERIHPILPAAGKKNILITSALPYVNNVPHLGNIIGCVLSADVFSRYCRLRGYNVLYICGTDEYGTATETKAIEEGLTPQQICDKYHALHKNIYDWFNIDFDYFGRTTTPQQTEIAQDIFWKLHHYGYISTDKVEQLKCESCDRFLADRFVEGGCPHCQYDDARGDQCDKCGKLINAVDLKNPRCKLCSSEPKVNSSDHIFLDLTNLQQGVTDWSKKSYTEGIWSHNAKLITTSWLRDGLKPRCITRDLHWGTPVPLDGYKDKVFYVWFDAPIGYLSITACYTKEWEKWWKNPDQVQLYQFMAKDNVPFHTVVFPCSLIGANDNYVLLNNISATEYLNYEDGKFSKSRGVGVFGNNANETDIPADIYRFYLLYIRPESQDSAFSWADLVMKNNSELLNNLGNFINRSLMFLKSNFDSIIPQMDLSVDDLTLIALVTREIKAYISSLESLRIRDGIRYILNISRLGNAHIQANQPWKLVKGSPAEKSRAGSLIGLCANITCYLSIMLQPYMPAVSDEIQRQLQAPKRCNVLLDHFVQFLVPGHKIGKPTPLFNKIEADMAQQLKERFQGKQVKSSSAAAATATVSEEQLTKQQ